MHYLEKITKKEFQSFKEKEDTKALSIKWQKNFQGFKVWSRRTMPVLSGLFSYKAHRAPTKLVAPNSVSRFGLCRK